MVLRTIGLPIGKLRAAATLCHIVVAQPVTRARHELLAAPVCGRGTGRPAAERPFGHAAGTSALG
jgi:hypothetical protein